MAFQRACVIFPPMTYYVEDCTSIRIIWECGTKIMTYIKNFLIILHQENSPDLHCRQSKPLSTKWPTFYGCFQMSTHAQSTKQNGRRIWAWPCYKPELDIDCTNLVFIELSIFLASLANREADISVNTQ